MEIYAVLLINFLLFYYFISYYFSIQSNLMGLECVCANASVDIGLSRVCHLNEWKMKMLDFVVVVVLLVGNRNVLPTNSGFASFLRALSCGRLAIAFL